MCSRRRFSAKCRDAPATYPLPVRAIRAHPALRRLLSLNRVTKTRFLLVAAVLGLAGAAAILFLTQASSPALFAQSPPAATIRFAIIGDRTGETVPGIYEAVWREVSARKPAFVVGVGDSIQGMDDATAEKEWVDFTHILAPFRKLPFFNTAGNHDVFSEASAKLYAKYSGHPLHYSFDEGPAHFTVLDNSRTDDLQPEELSFLEQDLQAHELQPVKFIVSHRPAWLLNVILRNPDFPVHKLAEKYGVHYVIAGHVHEMMHSTLEGVEYISVPSAGGHLRASEKYEDGWFFGYTIVTISNNSASFEIHELPPPDGEGRVTPLSAWGAIGLVDRSAASGAPVSKAQ